ncbi:MAG TPA: HDOD domain-containing protein, partial [Pirellulaceae bacterium]
MTYVCNESYCHRSFSRTGLVPRASSVKSDPPVTHASPAAFAALLPMTEERRVALERLFARIGEVACLPAAAERVLRITESENTDADELCEAIQNDPVLVARVLRRLNSSYYSLSQKISDLKTAVNLLGQREIRNLALTVFVSKIFEGGRA